MSRVTDTDHGAKALLRRSRTTTKVTAGIMNPVAQEHHRKSGINIGWLAVIHEFGNDKIRRSAFVRDTVDQDKAAIEKVMKKVVAAIARGRSPRQAVNRLGTYLYRAMRRRCPVDTGQLRASIQSTVEVRRG